MGRTEKSQGLAPPAVRKDIRAKQARHVVTKVVPTILASNVRARRGADGSELIPNPGPNGTVGQDSKSRVGARVEGGEDTGYVKRKGQGRRKVKGGKDDVEEEDARNGDVGRDVGKGRGKGRGKKRNDSLDEGLSNLNLNSTATSSPDPSRRPRCIRMITTDALTAAHMLANPSLYDATTTSKQTSKKQPNPCILNMASPLRPGGGLLTGATSAEESLCARTTLLPSLKESFYRLPEYGGIYTHDVLVFRSALPLGDSAGELSPTERWYVDVISAGMLRFPELEGEEDEERRLSKKDREIVESKIRSVLRIVEQKGVKVLVLGAWGVGAYGNPVRDVAEAFAKVLGGGSFAPSSGGKKNNKPPSTGAETFPSIENIIFAIPQRKVANDFAAAFGGKLEVEEGPGASGDDNDEEDDEEDKVAEELRSKIQEMDGQISKVWNPDLKARLGTILDGLKAQLREREGTPRTGSVDDEEEDGDGDEDDEDEGDTEESDEADADDDDQDLAGYRHTRPGKLKSLVDDSDDDDDD